MRIPNLSTFANWPLAGTVVWVPTFVVYRHKGIVSDRWQNGRPMVISGSARNGRVCEESWDEFAQGNQVFIDSYPSELPSYEVLRRARERLDTRYRLLDWNCEHVVAYAHGFEPQSPQVAATILLGIVAVGAFAAAKGK